MTPQSIWEEAVEACAKWHDQKADNAKMRRSELNRYSDSEDERASWRSWKDTEDRHRSYATSIRTLKQQPPASLGESAESEPAPTPALVEALDRSMREWIRNDLPVGAKMMILPEHCESLVDRVCAALEQAEKGDG